MIDRGTSPIPPMPNGLEPPPIACGATRHGSVSEGPFTWHAYRSGTTLGSIGSESGIIEVDDEYEDAARITVEYCATRRYWAITCGLYGWMVHTHFCAGAPEARRALIDMKRDLAALSKLTDPCSELRAFVERFQ